MTIQQDIRSLAPGQVIELYELDATALGGAVTRITSNASPLAGPVVWQGNTYNPFPVDAEGFDYSGQGSLPRPKMKVANVTGAMSVLAAAYGDLLGAKLTRRRTLAKYLDAANWPALRNLLLNSDTLVGSGLTAATVTADAALNSRGEQAADQLTEDTSAGTGHFSARTTQALASGAVCTASVSVRPAGVGAKRYLSLHVRATGPYGASQGAVFDPATGAATFVSAGCTAASAQNVDGSWRVSVTFPATTATGAATLRCQLCTGSGTLAPNYTGDGVSGLLLDSAQFEVAAAASAYQAVGSVWSPNPSADPTAAFPDEVFFIDRKSDENPVFLEFELAAAFDVQGVQLPRGVVVQNVCPWQYRLASDASGCTYAGTSYFDANDAPVGSLAQDVCSRRLSGCKVRHPGVDLPFGGIPGAGMVR